MALGPFPDIDALAAAVADDLCVKPGAPLSAKPTEVASLVAAAIHENLQLEREVEREAEEALRALGSSTAGLDRGKLVAGLRERIAKKKGFVP